MIKFANYFIIVRHGETPWNYEGKLQGRINITLSEKGRWQAREIGECLKNEKIDVIYSSDLPRAIETAKEINKYHALKIIKSKKLREIDLGKCNGLTIHEICKRFPNYIKKRKLNHFLTPYPAGESYKDVQERVKKFLNKIDLNNRLLIAAHQGVNRILIGCLTGLGNKEMLRIDVPHDVIYLINHKNQEIYYIKKGNLFQGYLSRDSEFYAKNEKSNNNKKGWADKDFVYS